MAIETTWDNDSQTIIRYDFEGGWNWTEYHQAAGSVRDMMLTVEHEVCTIADFSSSGPLPNGAIREVKRALDEAAPNAGLVVIIPNRMYIQVIAETFMKIYRPLADRIKFASSLEEARQKIAAYEAERDSA